MIIEKLIENASYDIIKSVGQFELKNPELFCISGSGDFKVQIFKDGILASTMFMYTRNNDKCQVEFRPPKGNKGFYRLEVHNREVEPQNIYISIWDKK